MASPVWKKWIALVRWIMFSSRTFRSRGSLRKRKSCGIFGGSAAALLQGILFTTNDFPELAQNIPGAFSKACNEFCQWCVSPLPSESAGSGKSSSSRHGSVAKKHANASSRFASSVIVSVTKAYAIGDEANSVCP
eukprot:TRINITY_DN26620_c0_g1_i1.p4 TRINITY_DN26620_c0_g1~~TRINITY_DN26620_c0_g1_i1.p4  ORF type:complete len:135 (+),score=21.03 TRINITY_DN26620_c0_g1_i1:88-492(+)